MGSPYHRGPGSIHGSCQRELAQSENKSRGQAIKDLGSGLVGKAQDPAAMDWVTRAARLMIVKPRVFILTSHWL